MRSTEHFGLESAQAVAVEQELNASFLRQFSDRSGVLTGFAA